MTDHSSITSVTEEDSDESDTTQTSYSKASDSVSSIMYSSECNTDDKITPSLGKISISKPENSSSNNNKRRQKSRDNQDKCNHDDTSAPPPFPYRCDPLPLRFADKQQKSSQARKKQKKHSHCFSPLTNYVLHKNLSHQKRFCLPKQEEENFGIEDPENYLYTDFSDTSSIPWNGKEDDEESDEDDDLSRFEADDNHRPFIPDMRSDSWFQAKCFDRYWSHYGLVMDWYKQHVQAVNSLSAQFSSNVNVPMPNIWPQTPQASQPLPRKRNKSKRAKNRARNRRLAKARQKEKKEMKDNAMENIAHTEDDSYTQENDLEMEITDEMMEFFATSFKHRLERDKKEGKVNADVTDQQTGGGKVNLAGPSEQPGVRRTSEMRTLYGHGAPMIHGMETAMQMTFDNIVDRCQPNMWPNMPLKIIFA